MARDETIKIRITTEKKEQLQSIADDMGLTMSALGAYIIGQWVMQYNNVSKPIQQNAVNLMTEKFQDMSKEDIAKIIGQFAKLMDKQRA